MDVPPLVRACGREQRLYLLRVEGRENGREWWSASDVDDLDTLHMQLAATDDAGHRPAIDRLREVRHQGDRLAEVEDGLLWPHIRQWRTG